MSEVKNILILGGTGAMGVYLVSILNELGGAKIYVTSRDKHHSYNNIEYWQGDAKNTDFLYPLLKERLWDAIVDFMSYSTVEFSQRVDKLLSATRQYIFLSSSRVYAESCDPIKESNPLLLNTCRDTEYLSTDEYALKKARQENILKTSGRNNWTIIRPYVTFSEYRLQLSALEKEHWLYRAINGRAIVFSKDLAERETTFTYGYDVAQGIASILGKNTALGQEFHITNNDSFTWNEILSIYIRVIEEATGSRPRVHWLDKWEPFMGGNEPQVKWDRLYNRIFDTTKISQYIDTTSFSPTRLALAGCLKHFICKPQFKQIDWLCEAEKDKRTGDWARFKEIPGVRQKVKYYLARLSIYSRY